MEPSTSLVFPDHSRLNYFKKNDYFYRLTNCNNKLLPNREDVMTLYALKHCILVVCLKRVTGSMESRSSSPSGSKRIPLFLFSLQHCCYEGKFPASSWLPSFSPDEHMPFLHDLQTLKSACLEIALAQNRFVAYLFPRRWLKVLLDH